MCLYKVITLPQFARGLYKANSMLPVILSGQCHCLCAVGQAADSKTLLGVKPNPSSSHAQTLERVFEIPDPCS